MAQAPGACTTASAGLRHSSVGTPWSKGLGDDGILLQQRNAHAQLLGLLAVEGLHTWRASVSETAWMLQDSMLTTQQHLVLQLHQVSAQCWLQRPAMQASSFPCSPGSPTTATSQMALGQRLSNLATEGACLLGKQRQAEHRGSVVHGLHEGVGAQLAHEQLHVVVAQHVILYAMLSAALQAAKAAAAAAATAGLSRT